MTDVPSPQDLLAWLDKAWVPQLRHFVSLQVNKAVQDAERPLRARIKELEAELARTRAAVAAAVGDREAA